VAVDRVVFRAAIDWAEASEWEQPVRRAQRVERWLLAQVGVESDP